MLPSGMGFNRPNRRKRRAGAFPWSLVRRNSIRLLGACVMGTLLVAPAGPVRGESRADEVRAARLAAERAVGKRPGSQTAQIGLAEASYRSARDALDRLGDEGRYLLYLRRSLDACVAAMKIDSTDHRAHFYLALIDAYRGDLRAALLGFCRVEKLNPSGIAKTNLAEIFIYLGDLDAARIWNQRGGAHGAGPGPVAFNDMLIDWKMGDVAGARSHFRRLRAKYPEMLESINAARLPVPPNTFAEFTEYCCGSPACGPYLDEACTAAGFEVEKRQISEKGQHEELQLRTQKGWELERIYGAPDEPRDCVVMEGGR